jgi:hypothetical protein
LPDVAPAGGDVVERAHHGNPFRLAEFRYDPLKRLTRTTYADDAVSEISYDTGNLETSGGTTLTYYTNPH